VAQDKNSFKAVHTQSQKEIKLTFEVEGKSKVKKVKVKLKAGDHPLVEPTSHIYRSLVFTLFCLFPGFCQNLQAHVSSKFRIGGSWERAGMLGMY
jgi:hypothetical protein